MFQGRDFDDPPGLLEKTEFLLKEWLTIYSSAPNRDPGKTFSVYIHQVSKILFVCQCRINKFFYHFVL